MNCKKAEPFLVEYLYQELSASKTVELEAHLMVCDGCTSLLQNWKAIHQGFQAAEAPQAPPFLKQRILSNARAELERKPSFAERTFVFLRPALLIPAAVIAVFALLLFGPSTTKMAEMSDKPTPATAPEPVAMKSAPRDGFLKMASKAKADEILETEKGRRESESSELQGKQYAADDGVDRTISNAPVMTKKGGGEYADKDLEMQRAQEAQVMQEEAKLKEEAKVQKEMMPSGGMAASAPPPAASLPQPGQASPAEQASQPMVAQKIKANEAISDVNVESNTKSLADNFEHAQENFRQDHFKTGVKIAQQVIDQDKNKELAAQFYNAGVTYQTNKEYTKAIFQYKMLVNNYQAYQALNDVLFRLGECYAEIGKVDDARMIFEQLLKSNYPNRMVLREKLAVLERQRKDTEELRSLGYVDQQ